MTPQVEVASEPDAYAWALTARHHDLGHWRRTVAGALLGWGGSPAAVELARLGVSELVGNVWRHVDDPRCFLALMRSEAAAVVQVFDRSPHLPVVTEPRWDRESGRGLWLLREMAGGLGFEQTSCGQGKWVWFRCDLAPAPKAVPR